MTFGELKDALIIAEGAMEDLGIDLEDMEAVCLVQYDKNMICDKLIFEMVPDDPKDMTKSSHLYITLKPGK